MAQVWGLLLSDHHHIQRSLHNAQLKGHVHIVPILVAVQLSVIADQRLVLHMTMAVSPKGSLLRSAAF